MKESGAPAPTATAPVGSAPKSQQQQRTAVSPPPNMSETNGSSTNANENGDKQESEGVVPLMNISLFIHILHYLFFGITLLHYFHWGVRYVEMLVFCWTAEGYSIFVKGLPFNATPPLLEDVFKKFGPIKSDGIQVRTQKVFAYSFSAFCYHFISIFSNG